MLDACREWSNRGIMGKVDGQMETRLIKRSNHFNGWKPHLSFANTLVASEIVFCSIQKTTCEKQFNSIHKIRRWTFVWYVFLNDTSERHFYNPMRPQKNICEWQWSNATDTNRSCDNENMVYVVYFDCIHTTHKFIKFTFLTVLKIVLTVFSPLQKNRFIQVCH